MDSKIKPFLWFDSQAGEAAEFYVSVFKNSKITTISHYPESSPVKAGEVLVVAFELDGMPFMALNAGPEFKFNPAVSFVISCDTQEEVDGYWSKLTADGGKESQCGWLEDKFGLSWQVVPNLLGELITDPDPAKAGRVMGAMMQMQKIDMQALQDAYDGK